MVITCGFEEANPRKWFSGTKSPVRQAAQRQIAELGPDQEVTSLGASTVVYKRDFDTLQDGAELSPGIVNFAFGYLQELVTESQWPNRVCLLSNTREHFDWNKNFLFFPVCCGHGDWSLLVLCTQKGRGYYYNGYRQCQEGFTVAQQIMDKAANILRCSLLLLELHTPQQYLRQDSGILVCEISALLVRRLVHAKPYHRISLGLTGAKFIARAGRTILTTLIVDRWTPRVEFLPQRASSISRRRAKSTPQPQRQQGEHINASID